MPWGGAKKVTEAILLKAAVSTAEIPNWFAVCMGIGTVFIGLICIIIICKIMSALCGNKNAPAAEVKPAAVSAPIENRQEILAAVCAAAAEEMGTDISALRVVSFKKL